jgi:hypothetical protein
VTGKCGLVVGVPGAGRRIVPCGIDQRRVRKLPKQLRRASPPSQDPAGALALGVVFAAPDEDVFVAVVASNLLALLGRVVDRGDARVGLVLSRVGRDLLEEVGQGEEVSLGPEVKV